MGATSVDRRQPPVAVQADDVTSISLAFTVLANQTTGSPYGTLNLHLPTALAALSEDIQVFLRVQNLWSGWLFGNNPASTPVLQEMAYFSWIQSILEVGSAR